MLVEEVDLRSVPAGCTSHPAIRLKEILRTVAERRIEEIRLFFKEDDIPKGIMELFLKNHGYIVKEVRVLNDGSLLVIARRRA